ncbi:uncharacterized protein MONOS_7362 [Monocercomonoides exilis]|uniref:uncharacterized protein n=1 Tax=Monocercomonoides exilis TaxID=2049356 RepID=UPI00355993F3|nr:hypothetical protein MONOS_7362 [Monocercomonoides exilis]|eukprot:MONOS_7362.1-p1 / transcript=MONOS_7362.1 / gene=MONOS_7362 / organism=Monocercomonoides_exilis_PA203 / gene_product=unspecified product / transcript_product=unspecified product / location=Mono_scaffold00249:63918-64616(+) / protein_length=233 / sequence_SO=supercontig / SO=protein_coding / is_pseudo=false
MGVTAEGRKDSPEAVRVIKLLQPALESGFEAANAIAALPARELKKVCFEEKEKERLRCLFCPYALIAGCISRINLLKVVPYSDWENVKGIKKGGMSKDEPENLRKLVESTSFFQAEGDAAGYGASPDSTTGFGPTTARGGLSRRYSSGRSTQGFVYRQLQRRGYGRSFTDFKGKKRTPQFQAQFVPTIAGRPAPIIGPLPPAPSRTQGGTAMEPSIRSNKWPQELSGRGERE